MNFKTKFQPGRRKLLLASVLAFVLSGCGGSEETKVQQPVATANQAPVAVTPIEVVSREATTNEAQATTESDATLRDYQRVSGISGNLSSIGSDTLANLMTLWTEGFNRNYPSVNIQVQAAGSSTPTPIRVAIDALAVYVHKDNPLNAMSIAQVDAVFSTTRRCGAAAPMDKWGTLDLTGGWNDRPIQLYGRNSVSGTYGYFKKVALCSGDFKNSVNEQPGSASVVQAVASSLNGIGYSGIGYITSGVKALDISIDGGPSIAATAENAIKGDYPLARYLYVYVNKKPGEPLQPIAREFLTLVLSKEGQEIVQKDGYIPVSPEVAERELAKLL